MRAVRVLAAAAACLWCVAGCDSLRRADFLRPGEGASESDAAGSTGAARLEETAGHAERETTGTVVAPPLTAAVLQSEDPYDDLGLAKRHFRNGDFGLAERYFRRAVEKGPGEVRRDAEAWLGLGASYDRLRRFDLADRAYARALKILGPTPEVLNNQGYSYLLRGDYGRARAKLLAARDLDPSNPYIENNLALLDRSARPTAAR